MRDVKSTIKIQNKITNEKIKLTNGNEKSKMKIDEKKNGKQKLKTTE